MDFKFETIERWPYGGNGTGARRAPFRVSASKTYDLLKKELDKLGAKNVALQTGHSGDDIRFDGLPRVNARLPRFAGVCLTFEKYRKTGEVNAAGQALGRWEMLEFPCSTFNNWEDNIRAIALFLRDLRMSQRYGVGKAEKNQSAGEQVYQSFKHARLESETAKNGKALTREAAAAILAACAQGGWTAEQILGSTVQAEAAYKAAAHKVHPDHGGTTHAMSQVNLARTVLLG